MCRTKAINPKWNGATKKRKTAAPGKLQRAFMITNSKWTFNFFMLFHYFFYRSKLHTKRTKEEKLLSGCSTRNIVNIVCKTSFRQCVCVCVSSSTWIVEGVWRLPQTAALDQSHHVQRIFNFILPLIRLRCQRRHTLAAARFNWFCRQRTEPNDESETLVTWNEF